LSNGCIADDLVFPSQSGTPIKPDNIAVRYMQPALEAAGLRTFRFHDLRHTFGSLLIHDGASLTYVKEQMGHSSIQITVDTYGHLIPGADISWVDRLDAKSATQPRRNLLMRMERLTTLKLLKRFGCPQGFEPRYADPESMVQPL
jgi:integrase